jgi:VWFA-related protein
MSLSCRGLKFCAAVAGLCLLALPSAAQTLSPGEVRISSGPYRPQSQILRAESRLVYVEVVVRDNHGRAVSGLTKDDFAVFDSGRRRDLAQFSVQTSNAVGASSPSKTASAPPATSHKSTTSQQTPASGRWIGLFFDDINTPPGDLGRAKIAARRFIAEAAQNDDRIGLFTTSGGQISQFTSDRAAVLESITATQSHPRMERAGLKACPRITPYEAYQIVHNDPITMQAKLIEACQCDPEGVCDPNLLSRVNPSNLMNPSPGSPAATMIVQVRDQAQVTWNEARLVSQTTLDAVRAAVDRLSQMPGKRVLLLVSSGFLSGDLVDREDEITNEALRAGVVINSLDSKGLYAEPPGRPLTESGQAQALPDLTMMYEARSLGDTLQSEDAVMARFAESTGGLLFRNNNDLDFGFRELGLVPAYAYELGFQPDEDGKYHKIKVEVQNAKHDFIQARPGYFAPTREAQEAASTPTPEEQVDAEVRGSQQRSDFPLSVSERFGTAKNGGHELSVQSRVDIQKFPFAQQKDRHVDMLTFVAVLFDAQGKMVTGEEAQMQLALKPESFERFSKSGINGVMSLEAPAGAYRLRVVVEEALHNEISATTQNVQIQ